MGSARAAGRTHHDPGPGYAAAVRPSTGPGAGDAGGRSAGGRSPGAGAVNRPVLAAWTLVAVGLLLWAAARFESSREHHAYAGGGAAPVPAQVHLGATYRLSVPGGVRALKAVGVDAGTVACTATRTDGATYALRLARESADTKAEDVFASFVSPTTGRVEVTCTGLGAVYLDDADDAGFDVAGLLLVLAVVALAVGLPLLLSGLRGARGGAPRTARSADRARQHHEVE